MCEVLGKISEGCCSVLRVQCWAFCGARLWSNEGVKERRSRGPSEWHGEWKDHGLPREVEIFHPGRALTGALGAFALHRLYHCEPLNP